MLSARRWSVEFETDEGFARAAGGMTLDEAIQTAKTILFGALAPLGPLDPSRLRKAAATFFVVVPADDIGAVEMFPLLMFM